MIQLLNVVIWPGWSRTATIRGLHYSEIGVLCFGFLLVIGVAGESIYSERQLTAVLAEHDWSVVLQQSPHQLTEWRRLATISMFLVLAGVLGELVADIGVFVFSARLEQITNDEVASLTFQAATFRDDANTLSQQIRDAQDREAVAEAKIAQADRREALEEKARKKLEEENQYQAHLIQQFTIELEVYIAGLPLEPLKNNVPSDIELLNHGRPVAAFVLVDPVLPSRSIVDGTVQEVTGNYELYPFWRDRLITHPMKELDGIDSINIEYGPFDIRTPQLVLLAKQNETRIFKATFGAIARVKLNVTGIGFHRFSREFFQKEDYPDPMVNTGGLASVPVITGPNDKTVPSWPAQPCVGGCGVPTMGVIAEMIGPGKLTFPTIPLPVAASTTVNLPACTNDESGILVAVSTGLTNPINFYYQYHPHQVFQCGGTFLVRDSPDGGVISTARPRFDGGELMITIHGDFKGNPYADVPALFDSMNKQQNPK